MILYIDVARDDNTNAEKKGTFKEPWPLVRVDLGTHIEWQIKNGKPTDVFVVSFPDGSPFAGVTAVNQGTGPLEVTVQGSFHYHIYLTDGRDVHVIHKCPILNSGGG